MASKNEIFPAICLACDHELDLTHTQNVSCPECGFRYRYVAHNIRPYAIPLDSEAKRMTIARNIQRIKDEERGIYI